MPKCALNYDVQQFDIPKTTHELFHDEKHDMALGAIMLYGNAFTPNIKEPGVKPRTLEETVDITLQGYFQQKRTFAYLATEKNKFDVIGVADVTVNKRGNEALVRGIVVEPEHRNHGLGSAIMNKIALDMADNGIQKLKVEARPEAIPFFQEIGFQKAKRKPEDNGTWRMQARIA